MANSKQTHSPIIREDFGPWLKRAWEAQGMNLQQFADACELNEHTVRKFLKPIVYDFEISIVIRIAKGLNMELGYVLHQLGLDLGASGVNVEKINRANAIAQEFDLIVGGARAAMSETLVLLDDNGSPMPDEGMDPDQIVRLIARALASIDATETRLAATGFISRRPLFDSGSESRTVANSRTWSEEDDRYLLDYSNLPLEELAAHLNRSPNAVRGRLWRLRGTSRKEMV